MVFGTGDPGVLWLRPRSCVLGSSQRSLITKTPTLEQETWDAVFLEGQHVGHVHTSVFREPGPTGDLLRIEHEEVFVLLSNNNRIETRLTTMSLETPDGGLLEFTSVLRQGELPFNHGNDRSAWSRNELQLDSTSTPPAGRRRLRCHGRRNSAAPIVAGSLKNKPLAPGETRTLRYLDVGTNQLATTVLTAIDFEETDLTTGSRRLLRVESKTSISRTYDQQHAMDDENGEILQGTDRGDAQLHGHSGYQGRSAAEGDPDRFRPGKDIGRPC
jgi:hypothetical protein